MCGIAGKCAPAGLPVPAEQIEAALSQIRYRGPDDAGIWTDAGVALGHVRLSILDLTDRAAQPMQSADGRYVLTFNGEIYNFRELRQELATQGVAVTSSGDTEVLLAYIATHGCAATFPRLEGDWAVAVWDTRDEVITLGRDLHGVKPLYYARTGDGGVAFASEVKALVASGLVAAEPDVAAIGSALLGYSVTWGDRTLYRGVWAVRPGEQLTFDRRTGLIERREFASPLRWVDEELQQELASSSRSAVLARLDAAVKAGVRSRMVSDAPLGCLASGGVDSSLIVANAVEDRKNVPLYHADVTADSERPAAEALAKSLGLHLRVVRVTDDDILDAMPDVTWHNDGPLTYHLNALPFFAVSRLASSDGIKVLLTGEGVDEYLLGYPEEALRPLVAIANRVKAVPRSWLKALSPKAARLFWPHPTDSFPNQLANLESGYERDKVAIAARAAGAGGSPRDRRSRVAALSLAQSHLVSLLHRNDRLGMAWGIEARFPFLAPDFARLAINLPDSYKLRRTPLLHDRRHPFIVDKWAIRKLSARRLPAELSGRPKRGFPVSIMNRLEVAPKFFVDGFLADVYSLDEQAIGLALGPRPSVWQTRLLLAEVWGQMFFQGSSADSLKERIHTYVKLVSPG